MTREESMGEFTQRLVHMRRRAGALLITSTMRLLSKAVDITGAFAPERHELEVKRDLVYAKRDRPLCLDVLFPRGATNAPALIYAHGGGFTSLSKETHAALAVTFAKMGFVVFNIDYRLAPAHPYPAAMEDAAAAFCWVAEHAGAHGADATRLVLAGESAGAGLITGLCVAACFERPEPYARAVYDTGVVPRCVLPSCGMFDITDPEALLRERPLPLLIQDRVRLVSEACLGATWDASDPALDFARPLSLLEAPQEPKRPLPCFHVVAGADDPVLPFSRRLAAALRQREVPHVFQIYPGGHAFNAFFWRRAARDYWRDVEDFLRRNVG